MDISQPLFLMLGDQMINMAHVHFMRPFKDEAAPARLSVAVDMGTRTFTWTPKTKGELDWLEQVCQVVRPGQAIPAWTGASFSPSTPKGSSPRPAPARPPRRAE